MIIELRVRSRGVNLQPDLGVKKTDSRVVFNAHVPYELNTNQVAACRQNKVEKYARHTSAFRDYLNTNNIKFGGIVIGARGAINRSMAKSLIDMGLSKWHIKIMMLRTIEESRLI